VGCVLDSACVSQAARSANFSNEGGVGGKICFLKIVNGMWLLRQCMEHWRSQGQSWTVEQLIEACVKFATRECMIDVNEPEMVLSVELPAIPGKVSSGFTSSAAAARTPC
jgi:rhamnulokinase